MDLKAVQKSDVKVIGQWFENDSDHTSQAESEKTFGKYEQKKMDVIDIDEKFGQVCASAEPQFLRTITNQGSPSIRHRKRRDEEF